MLKLRLTIEANVVRQAIRACLNCA